MNLKIDPGCFFFVDYPLKIGSFGMEMCIKVRNFVRNFVGKGKDLKQVVDKLDLEKGIDLDKVVDNLALDRFLVGDNKVALQGINIFAGVLDMFL